MAALMMPNKPIFTFYCLLLLLIILPTDARRPTTTAVEEAGAGSLARAEADKSGPSPGVGHKHGERSNKVKRRTATMLGGQAKDHSGPSPGEGH
ncbi:unnamed protein product [Linum trigynum]|uniref:Uncharacterized protein n=1 Tax=Linum trigynum TaxID=586398 RepID=A0AAV2GLF1_9ROSI